MVLTACDLELNAGRLWFTLAGDQRVSCPIERIQTITSLTVAVR